MEEIRTTEKQDNGRDALFYICIAILTVNTILPIYFLIPVYAQLLIDAFCCVYIGSKLSVTTESFESLKESDAWYFPLTASVFLFGLYILFKKLGEKYVNMLLTGYFSIIAVFSLSMLIDNFMKIIIPSLFSWNIPLPFIPYFNPKPEKRNPEDPEPHPIVIKLTPSFMICCCISCVVLYYYLITKHYVLSNCFGIAFCVFGIANMDLGSFKAGAILLSGLFFYDIFWVFGTDVMVTVAKKFDAPIKLIFPYILNDEIKYSMLGLGDIVIPGIFIAMLYHFDRYNITNNNNKSHYFGINLLFYIIGLIICLGIMYIFKHPQPALLYLVPCCLFSSLLQAFSNSQFGQLWNFKKDGQDKKDNEENKEDVEKKND